MVSSNPESRVSGIRLSSVVPAKDTGNQDYELKNIDLAMKLHYIKGVYFFNSEAVRGLTIFDLKKPMFQLLEIFYTASGRIRRSETTGAASASRPFIKCNDGGVRIVEAFCDDQTIEEWLAMDHDSRDDCLAYGCVLGPDLAFSPLVFVQFTWFKCGGMSLGLSWAHILGDPFSASAFISMWAQIMAGRVPPKSLHEPEPKKSETETESPASESVAGKLYPIKRVDPVEDHWQIPNNCNMKTHTFEFTAKQLDQMASNLCDRGIREAAAASHFEVISATVWKLLAKAREDSGPRVVTICRYNGNRENKMASNDMVLSTVEVDFNVSKSDVGELSMLIADKRKNVEEKIVSESSDLIMYGANLTFVDMEEADVYGLKLQGQKPVYVNYGINGVGEQGVVLVLPGPEEESVRGRDRGSTVTVVLHENQLGKLMNELNREWNLA